jgi:hypothetical protein
MMCFAQEVKKVKSVRTTTTTKMTTTPVAFEATTVVPEKTSILVYDEHGTLLRKATSGTKVGGKGVVDCAQVPCPSTFDPGIICWKCKERTVIAK